MCNKERQEGTSEYAGNNSQEIVTDAEHIVGI
jgi:hypothetical protein